MSTMYPSLAVAQTMEGITEYLSTTFALADADARAALEAFLLDDERGIFRGPYLKIRTPFRQVGPAWRNPLGWLPGGFRPYVHQAEAFRRLSTRDQPSLPTIVTTGTGSGKTEAFLLPLLDHARRARARDEAGIKAIILYPMNALVTDQARRLASLLHSDPALAGVTAGVYIGGRGTHTTSTKDHLVDDRATMRANPPDILLTNYKMLDLLLLREDDAPLWHTSRTSLQYIVLDEFHTYDGAQGTDVAMLLRRLGATLGVNQPERPLGRITPVATSATLGGSTRGDALRRFAQTVFGTPFGPDAIVEEDRLGADEVIADIDFELPIPAIDDVLAAPLPDASDPDSWQPLAQVFLGKTPADPVELGEYLRRSFLTRAVVRELSGDPVSLDHAVTRVTNSGVLQWGVHAKRAPREVGQALLRFLALISAARQDGDQPLLNLEVQLWTREVSRVLRDVSDDVRFSWWSDGPDDLDVRRLPAVFCRVCGRSGWQAAAVELDDALQGVPEKIWQAALKDRGSARVLIPVGEDQQDARLLDPETLTLGQGKLRVLVTPDETAARAERCPSCGADSAIRFVGSAVSTLVSVALTQLFGLDSVPDGEKKTLVFTDSVQDAAYRAAFIEGRAFQFNLRSVMARHIAGTPTLTEVAAGLATSPDADLYPITPPDFPRRLGLSGEFLSGDGAAVRAGLAKRLEFQCHLEVGLRSRLGRTLELTGAAAVDYDTDLAAVAELARATYENLPERAVVPPDAAAFQQWLLGLVDRLRTRGGILHDWLLPYITDDGKRWKIWGGAPAGMPKFPKGRPAPRFFTTATTGDFDSLASSTDTWLTDWTQRCLGISRGQARALLPAVLHLWSDAADGLIVRRSTGSGATVFGLNPDRLRILAVSDEELVGGHAQLHCPQCQHVQPSAPRLTPVWDGAVCPRIHCQGRLVRRGQRPDTFYRTLYRSGRIRRIVATEHTGLLPRDVRETVEDHFKDGSSPVDPNILACTPTLELGIDIGDLSSVALSSLPRSTANYLQRVGRAGRSTGNALILATVPNGPRDLYYFAEPLNLLAGQVVPPAAYLDASEILHRQYVGYCLDRVASGDLSVGSPRPAMLAQALGPGLEPDTWLRQFIDLTTAQATHLADEFLALFTGELSQHSQDSLRRFAQTGMADAFASAAHEFQNERARLDARLTEVATTISALKAQGHLDDEQARDLRRHRGEFKALKTSREQLSNTELLTGLVELSLLPNYNLVDDAATLDVALWWVSDDQGTIDASEHSFTRGSRTALNDFAPGAAFYALGQKVVVDAVDVGPAGSPLWSVRWLCPDCGWGGDQQVPTCPRCGGAAVADTGSSHRVLPLRTVSAEHNREDVLIDDDAEQREQRRFALVTTADLEPGSISGAWRLKDRVFAAEYSQSVTIRSMNFGPQETSGGGVARVGGANLLATRFPACTQCGVVDLRNGAPPRHRGWCLTRRGAAEEFVDLVLSHELHTQAVRILLPVSVFNVERRLTSFKAALLLGLREDFGGDPQHLDIVEASIPDEHGRPRRFLVVHDTVPGGTGYLDRLGQSDRVRDILDKARAVLADCPCHLSGRQACHRCLLSVVAPREIAHTSRREALDMIEDLLAEWDPEPIATIGGVDIGDLHLSELELRFREAVRRWVDDQEAATWKTSKGPKGDELDFSLGGVRWLMRPLVQVLANGVATEPDFLLTRQDAQGPPVAVYLDGKAYHADPLSNITADDAFKRHALRADGYRVWSLTWADVDDFEGLLDSKQGKTKPLLDTEARLAVTGEVGSEAALSLGNPIEHLLGYLSAPDSPVWVQTAAAAAMVLVRGGGGRAVRVAPGGLQSALVSLASGEGVADDAAGTRMLVPATGRDGLPLVFFFAGPDEARARATMSLLAVLDDSAEAVGGQTHDLRWREWLRWGNLAQFLTDVESSAQFWTSASLPQFAQTYVPLAHEQTGVAVGEEWQEVREFADPSLAEHVVALAGSGLPVPVSGDEVGPELWVVELSWPQAHVAIVLDSDDARDAWLREQHWHVVRFEPGMGTQQLVETVRQAVEESA